MYLFLVFGYALLEPLNNYYNLTQNPNLTRGFFLYP